MPRAAAVGAITAVAAATATVVLVAWRRRSRGNRLEANRLDTPTLLLDLDALEHNISSVASFLRARKLLWRPHCKAVRCAEIAKLMLAAGACGVTCAKVSQAAALVDGGVKDILIANQIVGTDKIAVLIRLARSATVCVAVDDVANLRHISTVAVAGGANVAVLVDIDAGMGRCGVPHDETERIVALCQTACSLPGITFRGLMCYDGHTQEGDAEARVEAAAYSRRVDAVRAAVEAAGVPVPLVSGAGSGNVARAAQLASVTEVQAGGGIFFCQTYDQYHKNWGEAEDLPSDRPRLRPCLYILSQVVSTASKGRAVVDAGFKASFPLGGGLPRCVSHEGISALEANAEHLILKVPMDEQNHLDLGDRLVFWPFYSDSTTLLHRRMYGVRWRMSSTSPEQTPQLIDPCALVVEREFDLSPSMGALF